MQEGTINSWLVKEGQAFSKGDVLGEIAIEKLSNELLAEEDGVVVKIVAEEGATIPCGGPILIVKGANEPVEALESAGPAAGQFASPSVATRSIGSDQPTRPTPASQRTSLPQAGEYNANVAIAPKALQLAQELGVDYHSIKGTGRFGMVTREDIQKAVSAGSLPRAAVAAPAVVQTAPLHSATESQPLTQMQSVIARSMADSLRTSAQTTITMDADAASLVSAYRAHKEEYNGLGLKLTYTAILIKLAAQALVEHKLLRSFIDGTDFVTRNEINIGIAIDIPQGLVVPNIKDAQHKSLRQITAELEDLGKRARSSQLKPDEMSGGAFTLSNLGSLGIKYFTPVLNPGESALLGIGTIQDVPYVKEGGIFIKPVLYLSLTHDHRVVNGAPAARFLQTLQQLMNACESLFKDQETGK
jgi:pyruvate dehydrogenase E2 component (dihydrolipoamide acetyltransferase)